MVNNILVENLPRHVNLIDVENLLLQNTNTNWQDNRMYSLAKQPFSMSTIPPLVKSINNNIIYSLGITKKVIVIDLDNTIWGGIIGDDGIGGIELGDETPEGEAFVRFQKYLKKLSKNGLILCVCSKNDESIAKEVFKKHKSMVLKLDDVSIFVANYNDKATNIKKISKTLNLGLDSFVFIDDSKIECSIVKKVLPDVSVVNVSNDPSEFINIIEKLSLFNFRNVTDEDINRVQSYKKINQLHLKKSSTNNLEKFLQDLKPTISIEKVNPINVIRGSQLIAKTNQFKFNSKTYSEKELLKQKKQVLLINFKDNIQNYGIISSLVFGVD
ncbi:HAD-IIIC family phosphatase, partial [Candidatus Pelagibacter ubique]|nr:HAD-IIIC family phosphatase [Candidatus Pelagibacter ubique]